MTGGSGNDTVLAGPGFNSLNGGGGVNTLSFADSSNNIIVANLAAGSDNLSFGFSNFQNATGSSGWDVLTGLAGNNVLDGNGDNVVGTSDTLIGGGGGDTYVFNQGYGQLTIANGLAAQNVAAGTLQLGVGLTPNTLWFAQSGNNLVIDRLGSTDQIIVQGWFANAYSQLATLLLADGSTISTAGITTLASTMGVYQSAHTSFNPQTATALPSDPALQGGLNSGWSRAYVVSSNQTVAIDQGNVSINVRGGGNILDGGAGQSSLDYDHVASGVTVDLTAGTDSLGNTISHFGGVVGTAYNDTFLLTGQGGEGVNGLSGSNTVSYQKMTGTTGISVNLQTGADSAGDSLTNTQNVVGPSGGNSSIFVANVSGTVTVAGTGNSVIGYDANETINGVGSSSTVDFGNGNDSVNASGSGMSIILDDGNDVVTETAMGSEITLGNGNDTVNVTSTTASAPFDLSWATDNTVWLGDGQDTVNVAGNDTLVFPGGNNSSVAFAGSNNEVDASWATGDSFSDTSSSSQNTFLLYDGSANLSVHGSSDTIMIDSASATITDAGSGMQLFLGPAVKSIVLSGFAADPTAHITVMSNASVAQEVASMVSDGHGGSLLSSWQGSIDFVGVAPGALSASQLSVSQNWFGSLGGDHPVWGPTPEPQYHGF